MRGLVHSIWDFWDCPRSGIADFNGKPHYFECTWEAAADDYSEEFVLKEVTETLMRIAREYDAIWERWKTEFDAGRLSQDTHPAIEGQNPRFLELRAQIESEVATLRPVATATPKFGSTEEGNTEVSWRVAA